jgi:secondary thiamine-phosphate synthase enzyme
MGARQALDKWGVQLLALRPVKSETHEFQVSARGQGLTEITAEVQEIVSGSGMGDGLCTVFIPHTSASLVLQENADPSARADLERWLVRLVPEGDPAYTHTSEGADDMPAHIKAALTATSVAIPVSRGRLTLGTWQGIYLWEHRRGRSRRRIVVQIVGE